MSKRAEEKALELFPIDMQMCIDNTGEPYEADVNAPRRKYVAFGYEQAEKDLALTWEDVKAIVTIADSMLTHTAWDAIDWPDEQKYYEEVLRRFNEQKKK